MEVESGGIGVGANELDLSNHIIIGMEIGNLGRHIVIVLGLGGTQRTRPDPAFSPSSRISLYGGRVSVKVKTLSNKSDSSSTPCRRSSHSPLLDYISC